MKVMHPCASIPSVRTCAIAKGSAEEGIERIAAYFFYLLLSSFHFVVRSFLSTWRHTASGNVESSSFSSLQLEQIFVKTTFSHIQSALRLSHLILMLLLLLLVAVAVVVCLMQLLSSTRIDCKRYCLWWHSTLHTPNIHEQKTVHKNAHFWFIHMHAEWLVIRLLVEWPLEIRNAAGSNISNNHKFKWRLWWSSAVAAHTAPFHLCNANPMANTWKPSNPIHLVASIFALDFKLRFCLNCKFSFRFASAVFLAFFVIS